MISHRPCGAYAVAQTPLDRDKFIKELGDLAWYLALGCTVIGEPMEKVLQANIDKLLKRYPDGFDPERTHMRKFLNLTERNCLVFLRDRSAVFFSLLSMLIVLMLMGVFLANMNVESVTGLLEQYGGIRDAALDKENAGLTQSFCLLYLVELSTMSE